jgi:serine acetyltransferase
MVSRFGEFKSVNSSQISRHLLMVPSGLFLGVSHIVGGVHISPEAEIGPGLVIHAAHGIFVPKCKIG